MTCVLVVDDDATMRLFVAEVLLEAGYIVRVASNGAEALTDLDHHRPSAVLLDLRMPVLDGWTFLERCQARSDGPELPIIVLSADGPDRGRLAQLGAFHYLAKPVDADVLLALVRETIGPPLTP